MTAAEQPAPQPDATPEDEFPESWLPWKDSGQPRTLVGRVEAYTLGRDFGYGWSWICTLVDRDGKPWSIWIGSYPDPRSGRCSVLYSLFRDEADRVKPGAQITVRYRGFVDNPRGGGPGYRSFGLTVQGDRGLPAFLRPQLTAAAESDIPANDEYLATVPDADVIEDDPAQPDDGDLFGGEPPW
jgi:hypothetical protein